MSEWDDQSKDITAITLFVNDLAQATKFYEEVFNLPVHCEDDTSVVLRFGGTLINLLQSDVAHELISPAPVGTPSGRSCFVFAITANDVDAVCEELARRGVDLLNGSMDRRCGIRTASFTDPSGYIWEIAH